MTEQEYADLSDLQLARTLQDILRRMCCFDGPNEERLGTVQQNVALIVADLEDKVKVEVDKEYEAESEG